MYIFVLNFNIYPIIQMKIKSITKIRIAQKSITIDPLAWTGPTSRASISFDNCDGERSVRWFESWICWVESWVSHIEFETPGSSWWRGWKDPPIFGESKHRLDEDLKISSLSSDLGCRCPSSISTTFDRYSWTFECSSIDNDFLPPRLNMVGSVESGLFKPTTNKHP